MHDLLKKITDLENEIALLPIGYISRKTINGKVKHYHQWTESGKKKSKYIDDITAEKLAELINKRRQLQQELKTAKALLPPNENVYNMVREKETEYNTGHMFCTDVFTSERLKIFAASVKSYKKRKCYLELDKFLHSDTDGRIFILYGLRRTGKTTLIRQSILSMNAYDMSKTAFIQVRPNITLADINKDLRFLLERGYKYIFIDEVTLAEDFIEGAALFSDIYATSGMKIVLSGTDSLGFLFSESDELYDRCFMLHTTFIPYAEFEEVLGISGIDEYIKYGGTMSLGGKHYNETSTFVNKTRTDEYIDSAIARNIQHSLKLYQYGGHFRHLAELYEKNELTSAINRVVEDINHRFTIEILTREFKSNDLGISKNNLRRDKNNPTDILDKIDVSAFTAGLKNALEILNKDERTVEITENHRSEIKEYLDLLDLTVDMPTEFLPVKNERLYHTVIAQPGLRYSQAESFIRQLLLDKEFQNISFDDRERIIDSILNEIKGRMMEDIILLETKFAHKDKHVFKLQFPVGEFDMVIADPKSLSCEIYEIKHSTEAVVPQLRFILDEEKCNATSFRYGKITRKAVIYRGEEKIDGDISYLNVEEYLKRLYVEH